MSLALPIDFNGFRRVLADTITFVTGLQCILEEQGNQNFVRPKLPYFSFKLTTPAAKTGDDAMEYVTAETFNRGGERKMVVSFHCYAPEQEQAYNFMAQWQAALELQTIQAILRSAKIAVWTIGGVADLTQLLNTGYEARAQMDVQFGIASNLAEDLGSIETVEIQGQVDTDVEIVDLNFDVP